MIEINLPPRWNGQRFVESGTIRVEPGGKAPKLKFQPGSYIRYDKQLWEIVFAYRNQHAPSEWIYALEMRDSVKAADLLHTAADEIFGRAGEMTPRVAWHLFRDTRQAWRYFNDIPTYADRRMVLNKDLVRSGELVRAPLLGRTGSAE